MPSARTLHAKQARTVQASSLITGTILDTATDLDSEVRATGTISATGFTYGPCAWQPTLTADPRVVRIPKAGDPCLIGVDDEGNSWIVQWYGGIDFKVVAPEVTALPSSPVHGQEIHFRVATGVLWHLRYNASGGTYKWEPVGGAAPIFGARYQDESINNSSLLTYQPATTAVAITIPLPGEYYITNGARVYPWAANKTIYIGADGCGVSAADNDSAWADCSASKGETVERTILKTLTASGTLSQLYRHDNNATDVNVAHRSIKAIPKAVG